MEEFNYHCKDLKASKQVMFWNVRWIAQNIRDNSAPYCAIGSSPRHLTVTIVTMKKNLERAYFYSDCFLKHSLPSWFLSNETCKTCHCQAEANSSRSSQVIMPQSSRRLARLLQRTKLQLHKCIKCTIKHHLSIPLSTLRSTSRICGKKALGSRTWTREWAVICKFL